MRTRVIAILLIVMVRKDIFGMVPEGLKLFLKKRYRNSNRTVKAIIYRNNPEDEVCN